MKMILELVSGPLDGETFKVGKEGIIGRDAEIKIGVDRFMSRRHCLLKMKGETILLQDLNSTNGTYVKGERLEGECELAPGDLFRAGRTWILVDLD